MSIITMAPAEFNAYLAQGSSLSFGYYKTAAGTLMVSWTDAGIHKAVFVDEEKREAHQYMNAEIDRMNLLLVGTDFQVAVWKTLLIIPVGQKTYYASIAQLIGRPTAYRAVANAVGDNKIAYFVPCHRVVRASGDLCGYRWGVARKAALLAAE